MCAVVNLKWQRATATLLAASDVITLALPNEKYPIAAVEALAVGLPVVATDAGGIPETVRKGIEG